MKEQDPCLASLVLHMLHGFISRSLTPALRQCVVELAADVLSGEISENHGVGLHVLLSATRDIDLNIRVKALSASSAMNSVASEASIERRRNDLCTATSMIFDALQQIRSLSKAKKSLSTLKSHGRCMKGMRPGKPRS
jgi:hypothetical protein